MPDAHNLDGGPMGRELKGQTALITGGSSGIGLALCRTMAARGLRVVLTGRDPIRTHAAFLGLPGPQDHTFVVGNLAEDSFLEELTTRTLKHAGGRLGLLIHAAGVHVPKTIEASSAADFDVTFATNLRAPFLLTAQLLPALRAARGQIVFINSSATLNPRPEVAAYTASKAGLRAFADSLRSTVNSDGIRVLSVFPGRTATPMQQEQFAREGREFAPGRLLQPEDVAVATLTALTLSETAELTEIYLRPNAQA